MTHRPQLHRTSGADRAEARAVQRAHRAGRLHRLRRGVFVERAAWERLGPRDRHILLAEAVAPDLEPTMTFSHMTAATLFGWPLLRDPPDRVHVIDAARSAVAHRADLVIHAARPLSTRGGRFAGVPVTDVLDTAVAVATSESVASATVTLDGPVRSGRLAPADLLRRLPAPPSRGSVRGRRTASLLDARHETPGESYTAVRLDELGFRDVVPQQVFALPGGTTARVDFWIPTHRVVVEFDGRGKYEDPELMGGRDARQVLWDEKIREDALRSRDGIDFVVRPTWWHLEHLDRFGALFRQHRVRLP